jgi:hypothetical protein
MCDVPDPIAEENLSHAWGKAFLAAVRPGVNELVPLSVTVTGFSGGVPNEDSDIRQALDACLLENGNQSCETVASTIFPLALWNPSADRQMLHNRYLAILPRLRRLHPGNKYGLYFERLTAYGWSRDGEDGIDQLDHIIRTRESGNHRRSALQAAIFDPRRDHTDQRQRGFPCLQHVIFTPFGTSGLAVTGFYATQLLFEKAYGNYLGLCRLGRFMAHEMKKELQRVTCFAAVAIAKRSDVTKSALASLVETARGRLPEAEASRAEPPREC